MLYNHQINHNGSFTDNIFKTNNWNNYFDYVFYFKSRDTLNSDWEKSFTEKVRMYPVL